MKHTSHADLLESFLSDMAQRNAQRALAKAQEMGTKFVLHPSNSPKPLNQRPLLTQAQLQAHAHAHAQKPRRAQRKAA